MISPVRFVVDVEECGNVYKNNIFSVYPDIHERESVYRESVRQVFDAIDEEFNHFKICIQHRPMLELYVHGKEVANNPISAGILKEEFDRLALSIWFNIYKVRNIFMSGNSLIVEQIHNSFIVVFRMKEP